jgi:membrane-associated phospholipid phosphatase
MTSLVVTAILATIAFVYLDVPLALHLLAAHKYLRPLNGAFASTVLLSVETVVILMVGVRRLLRGSVTTFEKTLVLASFASICSYAVNDHVLKICFGVPTPPEVMVGTRHRFHVFAGTEGSSFPSGHMVLASAFAGVVMARYQVAIKYLSALLLVGAVLLLAGGWHFLSDVLVGAFVGLTAGLAAGRLAVHVTT